MSSKSYMKNGKLLVNASGNQIYDRLTRLQYCCGCCNILKLIRERQIAAGFAGVNLIDMTGDTEYELSELITFVNNMAPMFLSAPWSGGTDYPTGLPSDYASGATTEDELWTLILAMGDKTIIPANTLPAIEYWHSATVQDSYAKARYYAAEQLYNARWWELYPFPTPRSFMAVTWQRAVLGYRAEIYAGVAYYGPDMDFTGAPPCTMDIYAKSDVHNVGDIFDKQGYSIYDQGIYGLYASQPSSSDWTTGVLIDMRAAVGGANPLAVPPNWQPEPEGDTGQMMSFQLSDWFAIGTWNFECVDIPA